MNPQSFYPQISAEFLSADYFSCGFIRRCPQMIYPQITQIYADDLSADYFSCGFIRRCPQMIYPQITQISADYGCCGKIISEKLCKLWII